MDSGPSKGMYYIAIFVGSIVGGYLPALFGVGLLSLTSIFTSAVGAFIAIYLTYKFFA
jgi:uncharacterized membrane protein YeaQ/YmgE (transglycosylase-associated protein family)